MTFLTRFSDLMSTTSYRWVEADGPLKNPVPMPIDPILKSVADEFGGFLPQFPDVVVEEEAE